MVLDADDGCIDWISMCYCQFCKSWYPVHITMFVSHTSGTHIQTTLTSSDPELKSEKPLWRSRFEEGMFHFSPAEFSVLILAFFAGLQCVMFDFRLFQGYNVYIILHVLWCRSPSQIDYYSTNISKDSNLWWLSVWHVRYKAKFSTFNMWFFPAFQFFNQTTINRSNFSQKNGEYMIWHVPLDRY